MKLTLFRITDGRVDSAGSVVAGQLDSQVLKEFPDVWAPDGKKLIPSDGILYLQAVHALMETGKDRWTELRPLASQRHAGPLSVP